MPVHIQYPLRQRNGHQARLAEAVLDGGLERVGAAELRVDDYELYGPVDGHGETNEKEGACDEARVVEGIGLAYDACASASRQQRSNPQRFCNAPPRPVALTLCCSPCS